MKNSKHLFLFLFLCLTTSCVVEQKAPSQNQGQQQYEEREWSGPGFYWGVYIDNETDYWNHYNNYQRGPSRQNDHLERGDERGVERGSHGGGGHR